MRRYRQSLYANSCHPARDIEMVVFRSAEKRGTRSPKIVSQANLIYLMVVVAVTLMGLAPEIASLQMDRVIDAVDLVRHVVSAFAIAGDGGHTGIVRRLDGRSVIRHVSTPEDDGEAETHHPATVGAELPDRRIHPLMTLSCASLSAFSTPPTSSAAGP